MRRVWGDNHRLIRAWMVACRHEDRDIYLDEG